MSDNHTTRRIRDEVRLTRSSQVALKTLYNDKIRKVAASLSENQIEVLLHQIVSHLSLTDVERSDLLQVAGLYDHEADTIVNLHDDLYGDLRDIFRED